MRPYSIAVAADAPSTADTAATAMMIAASARDALRSLMMFLLLRISPARSYGATVATVARAAQYIKPLP
jgi:hypothetical protein